MFSQIGELIFNNEAVAKTSDFTMGLEVEMQRVDETGNVSQEPYPAAIGDEKTNPWLTNDYLETMPEMVTPAASHSLDAMHYLYKINNALRAALAPGELLWPLSMPPKLPADKSQLRLAKMGPKKEAYLKEWTKRFWRKDSFAIAGLLPICLVPAQLLRPTILKKGRGLTIQFAAFAKAHMVLGPNFKVTIRMSKATLIELKTGLSREF